MLDSIHGVRYAENVPDPAPFVGRVEELAALRGAMGDARERRPQTVLVTGPAGIGKTSLIEQFLRELPDVTVLRANGEEWEVLVAFGVIDQLLRTAGVPRGRATARDRSLRPEETLDVGVVILEVVEGLEPTHPVVIVIDDAQWADLDSQRALLFAIRRLASQRVLTVFVEREDAAARLPDGMRRQATGPSGRTLRLGALERDDVQELAVKLGVAGLSARTAERLRAHTGGNPLFLRSLLAELPVESGHAWQQPMLPAPRAFVGQVLGQLSVCSARARALVEACSVLGVRTSARTAGALAGLAEPVAAIEEAIAVGLLEGTTAVEISDLTFPHPLVQAAVYENLAPTARVRLHRRAAELVEDLGAALRHRVGASIPPDDALAVALDDFARRETRWGAWASAAAALVEASRMSGGREKREERLLRAIDAIVSAGDLPQAFDFARDVARFAPGPLRDAALGYLAILRGRPAEAESRLVTGWKRCDAADDPRLAAQLALRWTLHSVGRLHGEEIVEWAGRAMDLVPEDEAVRLEAEAIRGLGLGFAGRVSEGLAAYDAVLATMTGDEGPTADRVRMAKGWLQLVVDDLDGLPADLAEVSRTQLATGSIRIAVWADVWRARADYLLGAWDDATTAADHAVSLLEETGHSFIRPVARWVAVSVLAGRGEWEAAATHVRSAATSRADYELAVVAAALSAAELAWARGHHRKVLDALDPVRSIEPRRGVDEPGLWPWQHLYGDALVSAGRLDDAAAFLAPHERAADERGRRSSIGRLAGVRGRLEAAAGRMDAAETVLRHGLDQFADLPLPFERALLELELGQLLRRRGRRREALAELEQARERFAALGARPSLERCDRELRGGGQERQKRDATELPRLTRQEHAIAHHAAAGMSNRDIASEMHLSIKTVQFHLANAYTKLGVHTRVQLANHLRPTERPDR